MKTVDVKISELKAADYNPRRLTDKQFEDIKASIEGFGVVEPIVVNQHPDRMNIIVGGHMRCRVLEKIGHKTVPVVYVNLTLEQEKELNIRLNKNTGEWDFDALANLFDQEDLIDWGFEESDFLGVEVLEPEETHGDDESPGIPEIPKTVLGDIYDLGSHRLMCGDSTSIDAVQKMMAGSKADMVFTDPPYNINYSGTMSRTTKNGAQTSHVTACSKYDDIENDKMTKDKFNDFMSNILGNITTLCEGAWYISFGSQTLDQLLQPLRNAGMDWKSIIIWMKNQSTISGKDYKSRFEPIVYGRFNECFYGERYNEEDVWQIQRTLKNDLHPTMKPIALVEKAISNSSKTGNLVLDLFGGSGSTLIACEKTGRNCRMMELDPKYCDVIVQRYVDYCNKNGREFLIKRNGEMCNDFS